MVISLTWAQWLALRQMVRVLGDMPGTYNLEVKTTDRRLMAVWDGDHMVVTLPD